MPKDQTGVELFKGAHVVTKLGAEMVTGTIVDIKEEKIMQAGALEVLNGGQRKPRTGTVVVMVPVFVNYIAEGSGNLRGLFVTMGQPPVDRTAFSTADPTSMD